MRATLCGLVVVLACLSNLSMPTAVAQHGHPLVGVWLGDWGPTPTQRSPVVIDLSWENTTLSGMINPGEADATSIKVGTLNSSNWTVHLEGEGKDERGNPLRIVVDGQIENLGSPKRTISGTWVRGTTKGTFKVTRE